jgi:NADH dehydrogenase
MRFDDMAAHDDSLRDRLVVVLGGSGFLGRHVAQELLARGARLRVVSRHPERAYELKPLGMLGQVQFVRADVTRTGKLATLFAGAHGVVNLVGAFAGDLDRLQGKGVGAVAATAKDAGVAAFVHVSAIGADAGSDVAYARTKADGEAAVLAAFPGATVLRPSLLFGPGDALTTMFGGLIERLPAIPVFAPEAKLQPLFVDDAAAAIANALGDPARHGGRTYELGGPEVVTMLELNQRIARAEARAPLFVPLPDAVSGAIAALGFLPGAPITRAQWKLLKAGNVVSGTLPGCAELGVEPRPMGLFLDRWLVRFRKHGRFGKRVAA